MNGDEERRVHEHIRSDTVSLREYVEALLRSLENNLNERAEAQKIAVDAALLAAKEAVTAALESAEKAVVTARNAQERVNEKQNEFRQTLVDQNATFLPRETFETAQRESNRRLENLEGTNQQGVGSSKTWGTVLGLAWVGLTLLGVVVAVLSTR